MTASAAGAPPVRPSSPWVAAAAVAFAARALAALLSDRVVADVLRYRKVAAHVLDVSWNPYLAPHLYPYPPVWVWFEAAAEWLSRQAGVSFALAVKAPVIAADTVLAALLARWGAEKGGAPRAAGWLYAVHPVAVLVTGFHGQFEAMALLALVCAVVWLERGLLDRSALAFSAAVALKSFPVLVLPFAALALPGRGARLRYAALALGPVVVLLLPYAIADLGALRRELLGYGGVVDFGWIGAWRALQAQSGPLARGTAEHWAAAVAVSKVALLAALALLWTEVARRRLRWTAAESALGVLLAFHVFYGALSAQYLLWPVPLALLLGERLALPHAAVATVALVGFYVRLAPGVLSPVEAPLLSAGAAQDLWMVGTAALWLLSAAWLARLVHRGWTAG